MATKFLNISTDNTLGGNSPSDVIVSSQKAIKEYVDSQGGGGGYHPGLFAHEWDDHLRNDVQWLRADTFSWQDGSVYEAAYNHLVDDSCVPLYAWGGVNHPYYTTSATPAYNDPVYDFYGTNGAIRRVFYVKRYDAETDYIYDFNNFGYGRTSSKDLTNAIVPNSTETIAGTTIAFCLSTDGHKICPASEESNVAAIYAATGVAWYYILDPDNQRFKLPRTQYNEVGLRDTVGKYVPESLPNITGEERFAIDVGGIHNNGVASGAFYKKTNGTVYNASLAGTVATSYPLGFDASLSSSAYQNDAPVQQRATQMYLYFYVGSFTQTALENTAGLNAGLFNGKADTDLNNVSAGIDFVTETQLPTAGNNYTWYRKYKSGWVEQGGICTGTADNYIVNLPVTMADSNYCISGISDNNSGVAGSFTMIDGGSQTTTGFKIIVNFYGTAASNKKIRWLVSGKKA